TGATPPPVTPGPASAGLTPNVAAALAYVLGFITGIIFLITSKDAFVRFHAWQSIVTSIAVMVVGWGLDFALGSYWWRVDGIWNVLVFALFIFLIYQAYRQVKYKLPFFGDLAEKMAAKQ
ncbi:MAG: hypothetical protein AAB817_00895, partial [Patescibacteria group bacterium]